MAEHATDNRGTQVRFLSELPIGMSHTFRKIPLFEFGWLYRRGTPWQRHRKPYWKPPKYFKKIRMQRFRAQERMALIKGKEFPLDRKVDIWVWN